MPTRAHLRGFSAATPMKSSGLLESVDFFRSDANRKLDPEKHSELGQFMTPTATARLMASMFKADFEAITVVDAGTGVLSLTAAFVDEICAREQKAKTIHAAAYEIDPTLISGIRCGSVKGRVAMPESDSRSSLLTAISLARPPVP
jgi:predicted RNA methylase